MLKGQTIGLLPSLRWVAVKSEEDERIRESKTTFSAHAVFMLHAISTVSGSKKTKVLQVTKDL